MRTDPPVAADERETLLAYLAYQRETVLAKTEGLTRAQLGRPQPPSSLTLAGLLHHLALVEESWLVERFAGQPAPEPWAGVDFVVDPDWEFRTALRHEPEQLRQRYRLATGRADAVIARSSLEELAQVPLRDGTRPSLRWVLLHLVEETARHAGHADLLREAVDGVVGE